MMVRVPSCNIDRPIYIWLMEIKLKDTRTPLHICRQSLPSFILISNKPHCWAIKKGSLWNKLAWWPLPASSIPMPPLIRPPITTTPHSSSPYILFLDISLVFTHGITPARVNHNMCFIKKMHLDVSCNARILLVLLHKTKLVMLVCLPSVVSDH